MSADPAHLAAQYAWAGATDSDKRAVAAIFKRFEDSHDADDTQVGVFWSHWQVHAYYVNAGRDLERTIADIQSQVRYTS